MKLLTEKTFVAVVVRMRDEISSGVFFEDLLPWAGAAAPWEAAAAPWEAAAAPWEAAAAPWEAAVSPHCRGPRVRRRVRHRGRSSELPEPLRRDLHGRAVRGRSRIRPENGVGFALLVFDLGEGGYTNYISNAERPDVLEAMREFVAKEEAVS